MESSPYYIAFRGHSSIARSEKKTNKQFHSKMKGREKVSSKDTLKWY